MIDARETQSLILDTYIADMVKFIIQTTEVLLGAVYAFRTHGSERGMTLGCSPSVTLLNFFKAIV